MHGVILSSPDDFEAWRNAARALILGNVAPDDIDWQERDADLFGSCDPLPPSNGTFAVSRMFVDLAKLVVCHRDPERFALLYRLLYRLQEKPALIHDHADPLVRRLEDSARTVRRDIHKMRAFVRFREVVMPPDDETREPNVRYIAWFEPDHHIVRINSGFFVRRFANMTWSILTPELCIHWDGQTMTESPGATRPEAPDGDPVEEMWKTYYASTFNPARMKIAAMLSEMPKKYWKNMPETALIPAMISTAQAREAGMISRQPACGDGAEAWAALRAEASACVRCPLHRPATQTVFGQGPVDASLVFVGEQPGDQEDRAGHPFVGPAGQVFDRALHDAGIDRTRAYVTNAVKHFKFEQRGPRRIHAKPGTGEIEACRWWLTQELAIIAPRVIVALGATAAHSLFGKATTITSARGRVHRPANMGDIWVTVHPSSILRIENKDAAAAAYDQFVDDLSAIRHHLDTL